MYLDAIMHPVKDFLTQYFLMNTCTHNIIMGHRSLDTLGFIIYFKAGYQLESSAEIPATEIHFKPCMATISIRVESSFFIAP